MQNFAVAQMFDDIADYLEIAGENSFKIRAYRRAAEAIVAYSEPIEDAAENGTLREIEGLGEATTAKVQEFLATGKVRYLERLRDEYPRSLLELLKVPNLGPKKVAQLYRERNITSVEELIGAIEQGQLAGLSGFGPKTIENLRQSIERLAQMTTRLPIGEALHVAQNMVAALAATPAAERVEIAGSLRRGCDTVGNINLVATGSNAADLVQAFVKLPQVLSVIEQGEDKATVCVRPGIEVQLTCASPQNFGGVWFHATGSVDHLATAQQKAQDQGLTLQEDGLYRGGQPLATAEEKDIYAALEIPYILPELRENRGEWEAAAAGALPQLIEGSDIRGDLHTHSTWSDGAVTIHQMAQAMQERGYSYFAVTDHSKALAMTNGLNATRLRDQAKEIAEVQAEFPDLKILRGVECDILRDGTLDLDDDILHELDIVIVSVHSGFKLDEATQTARMIKAIEHPAVDIVAHPTGRILGGRPGYAVNVDALIEAAHDTNTALEINSSERLDLNDIHARTARDRGVLLSIDSDAHSPRMLPNMALGILTARRAWCGKANILNTKTTDELLQWLHRPQAKR